MIQRLKYLLIVEIIQSVAMIWGSILSLLKKAQCCKIDPLLMSSTFLEYNYFHPCKNKYSQAFGNQGLFTVSRLVS